MKWAFDEVEERCQWKVADDVRRGVGEFASGNEDKVSLWHKALVHQADMRRMKDNKGKKREECERR